MKIVAFFMVLLTLNACSEERSIDSLVGTEWLLTDLEISLDNLVPETDYILKFDSETNFSMNLDVNNCGGNYEDFNDGMINFKAGLACTKICCDSEFSNKLARLFPSIVTFRIQNDVLTLDAVHGRAIFILK